MDRIVFRNGQAIAISIPQTRKEEPVEREVDSLLPFLNCEVKIESATLGDIWRYIREDSEIYEVIFAQAMGQFPMKPYLDQIEKAGRNSEDDDPDNCIKYLELSWSCDLWEGELNISPDFSGKGPHTYEVDGEKVTQPDIGWGVEFTPINELRDYPLKLDTSFEVHDESNIKERKLLVEAKREWTVYEMIYGILYELTFVGLPKDQIMKMAEFDQTIAEIKDTLAKNKGEIIE